MLAFRTTGRFEKEFRLAVRRGKEVSQLQAAFNPSTFLVGPIWAHGYRLVKITRRSHSTVPKVCPEPFSLNANFNSMLQDSAGDNPRNSSAVPTFHPFFSNIFRFALFI
jgi:hypothetical protein